MDGLLLWRSLTDPQHGRFSPSNTRVLYERTSHEILAEVENFFASASPDDTLLLYFSGHGIRWGGTLYLASRNSIFSKPSSTAVSATELRQMIDHSLARATVVILDCCHSGAFKGVDDLSKYFKGAGRYVLAASRASELAKDSQEIGQPSPFTGAIVDALSGNAGDFNGDGLIDLEDIYNAVINELSEEGSPQPRRSFDGSGTVVLASVGSGSVGDDESGSSFDRKNQLPQRRVIGEVADGSASLVGGVRRRFRSVGDYSLGDFTVWATAVMAGFCALVLSLVVFNQVFLGSNSRSHSSANSSLWDSYIPEPVGVLAFFGAVLSFVSILLALVERFVLKKQLGSVFHRKDAVLLFDDARFRKVRTVRNVISLAAGSIVLFPISSEFQSPNLAWISLLAILGVNSATTLAGLFRLGDAAYAAGFVVLAACPFIPIYTKSIDSLGVLQLLAALLAIGSWLYRVDRLWLIAASAAGFLPLLIGSTGEGYSFLSVLVGGIGSLYSIISIMMGCGVQLDDRQEYRFTVISRRLRPMRHDDSMKHESGDGNLSSEIPSN